MSLSLVHMLDLSAVYGAFKIKKIVDLLRCYVPFFVSLGVYEYICNISLAIM